MAFERLLRLTKKCPGYVVSGLRNASWYSNCHSRVVRKPILHNPGSFWHPVTFCHDRAKPSDRTVDIKVQYREGRHTAHAPIQLTITCQQTGGELRTFAWIYGNSHSTEDPQSAPRLLQSITKKNFLLPLLQSIHTNALE